MYYKRNQPKNEPWKRNNQSLVAVNPERITTLLELASEYYGSRCAKCNNKRSLIVHHRHYRTIGFEKPGEDIVLLCQRCHDDLHQRAKNKQISQADLPYVDPQWEAWLPSEASLEIKKQQEENYKKRIRQLNSYPTWRCVFEKPSGEDFTDTGRYADTEEAQRNFLAEAEYYGYKLIRFEQLP